ncbi:E2 domain-associated cysteine-rich protein [Roseovarius sp.]|uniref:E2 domain-associated cysteine-rich protein n=1 Tax=Roseovarius sp. TaxID=1486281 RepID=UPI0032ED1C2C
MFRGKGWLADRLPRISKERDRVLNARSPCPRGCTWKHKLLHKDSCRISECYSGCNRLHKPILRMECPNRAVIEELVLREYERQRIESKIFDELRKQGKICCGSMKHCPLKSN